MTDLISKQAVLDLIADYDLSMGQVVRGIHALQSVTLPEEEPEKIKTEVNTNKKYIDGDLLFSKIAGHSNYHGDSILSAISCLQEGKEIKQIPAI